MEKGVTAELADLDGEDVVLVDWSPIDPEYPFNWSLSKKYFNVLVPLYICMLTSLNSASPGIMAYWGVEWFRTSRLGYAASGTAYLVSFAVASLLTAPLSELFGRRLIYQVATAISALLFLPQVFTRSLAVLLVVRAFGAAASAGNALIGGTIADLFPASSRSLPMNLFVLANFVGQTMGGVLLGWVGEGAGLQWCYGVQGLALAAGAAATLGLRETRSDVLLARRAGVLERDTGVRHTTKAALGRKSLAEMVGISCWRPLKYLFTEPIVFALCLWIGFNWSVIYLGTSSTLLVFAQYTSSVGLLGTAQLTMLAAGLLGFASSYHQEHLYRRACARSPTGQARPEARLYWAVAGAFLFPAAFYAYAWTGTPNVHWIVPALFLSIAMSGVSAMYAGVYNYLADAYETYSSSAQASHGFVRSVFAGTFPLFARPMYAGLGYPLASTVVASIALALASAPALLFVYGPALRRRSKVTSALTRDAF